MKTIDMEEATQPLADFAREVSSEPLVITDKGKPVAVLLALDNADLETVSMSSNPRFLDLIERSRSRLAREGGLSSDDVRRQLGIDR